MDTTKHDYSPVASSDIESSRTSDEQRRALHRQHGRSIYFHYTLYSLLLLSNIVLFGLWWRATILSEVCVRPKLSYSPAKQVISYEQRRLKRDIENNVFTGNPRPEFDAAWKHLLEPMTIKISSEELSHLPDPSIAFKDGSGYIAELAVYHEIHCIKRIRRHFHLDRYYPNMTEDDRIREEAHIDHCLEYWREAAMCRGDTTLATFRWVDGLPYSRVYSDHECVNWEALDQWARSRMVDMSDYGMLVQ
ncbi:hypothetical protein BDV32DRAFT_146148 [Aspergillus pseudonomiae]|uniref:Uncharacterized protein n=1 Tax=Aspergillus pseudonomiae TaxID=1506151 RepID=A0A5N6IC58_9EURO|nr:uncharacterized protein BDV37DRAFT_282102 [Aspergillus pseudonomiae]KAB8263844.1 hypothetical protein BDV32DRAFT_146148 [Aspergillus pseudonomiae]KAE8405147.1 hypothetical protein BDV37DRAFT_282102 [Aspergillus pseudonomiae]